jgi:ATP-dependent exoDNAse (exonuclease V) beta subunit
VAEAADQDRLRGAALEAALASADRHELFEIVQMVSAGGTDRDVQAMLRSGVAALHGLFRELDPGIRQPWGFEPGTAPSGEVDERRVRDLITELERCEVPRTAGGKPHRPWERAVERAAAAVHDGDWIEFLRVGVARSLLDGQGTYMGREVPTRVREVHELLFEQARAALFEAYQGRILALGRFVPEYDRQAQLWSRREGLYSFDDLAYALGRAGALGLGEELFYRLDGRIRHVLLDEFQDTSNAQWAALGPIVDEILSDHEGERAAFIVGDPKQSIYGWRGGEPRILEGMATRYGLDPLRIDRSWRSSRVVLDTVNRVFEAVPSNPILAGSESTVDQWMQSFSPHAPVHDLPGYLRIEAGPEEEARKPWGRHFPRLLAHAASAVRELHEEVPTATIGVLTRTNRAGAYLIARLRTLGIEASEEGGVPVADSGPVLALLALLRLADHPGDRISRYLVARTPVGEVVDLGPEDWRDEGMAGRLSRRLRARLLNEGYGRVVSQWVRAIGPRFPDRDRRRLRQLAELAFRWEERSTLRATDFVRVVESSRVEDPAVAAVRVMTLHRAKGLEFDAVVLPELDALSLAGDRGEPYAPLRSGGTGPVTRIFPRIAREAAPLFPEVQEALEQARDREVRDALSSLYVGLTRARYALYVYVTPDPEGTSTSRTAGRLLSTVLVRDGRAPERTVLREDGIREWWREPGMAGRLATPPGGPEGPDGAASEPLELSVGTRRRMLAWTAPSELEGGERVTVRQVLRPRQGEALVSGAAVHAWLEAIGWIEDGLPGEAALLARSTERAPGLRDPRRLLQDFRRWIDAEPIRAVLSRSTYPDGTDVDRELPFVARDGGRLVRGFADRVVRIPDPGGERLVVVDWKTDELEPSAERAVEERLAYYAPQMEAYARALARSEGVPLERVTAVLAFLRIGRTVVVPVRPS